MAEAYSDSCLLGHIQAYSIIILLIITLTFFYFNITFFSTERHVFLLQLRQFQYSTESTLKVRDKSEPQI